MSVTFAQSKNFVKFLGMVLATTLLVAVMPPIQAKADTPLTFASLPVNITAVPTSAFMGDNRSPTIAINKVNTADYPTLGSGRYYANLYDLDSQSFIVGGHQYYNSNGTTTINFSDHYIPPGNHHYQVIMDIDSGTNVEHPVTNPIGKSAPFTYTRKPMTLSLQASTSTFHQMYSPFAHTILNQELNGYSYSVYTFDITTDKLMKVTTDKDNVYGGDMGYSFGDPHLYQSYLAAASNQSTVKHVADLIDIQEVSNVLSLTREPWDTHIGTGYDSAHLSVRSNKPGGGEYASYLVDNASGNIVWDSVDTAKYLDPYYNISNTGHPNSDYSWATAYIAESYKPNGLYDKSHYITPPLKLSDLIGIQANSKSYSKSSSGVATSSEIAGGSNPSEASSQNCHCDPINTATGEFFENVTDMVGTGSGLKTSINRSFSITNKDKLKTMGYGWQNSYDMRISAAVSSDNPDSNILTARSISVGQENGSASIFYRKDDGTFEGASKTRAVLSYDGTTQQFTFVRDKTVTFVFNASGFLMQIKDSKNQIISINYLNNRISSVTDARGNSLTFAYNAANLTSSITDQNGKQSIYVYDASSNLIKVTDAQSIVHNYTYDASHRLVTLDNPMGGVTTNTYNGVNQVTKQTDALARATTFSYSGDLSSGNVIVTAPDGTAIKEVYVRGQLVSKTENNGRTGALTWSYAYDGNNNLLSVVNPDGSNVTTLHDEAGNIKSSIDSNGNTSTFAYDAGNNLVSVKDALGNVTTNTYDGQGNLLSTTNPSGAKTTFSYNQDGTLATATDARGNAVNANPNDFTSAITYTAKGLVQDSTDALGHTSHKDYDNIGRPITLTKPRGLVAGANASDFQTNIQYNTLNLPVKTIDSLQNETALTYDALGDVLTSKDALGNVSTRTYDLVGNILTATNALGQVISYHYDIMNRVDSITDAKGKISTITYDTFGRVIQTTDPLGRTHKQEWNIASRLVTSVDGDGKRTTYTYDPVGNVLSATDPLNNTTNFTYDAMNRKVQTIDAEGHKSSTEYDANGRVSKTVNPDATSSSPLYDAVGNVISSTNEAGKTDRWEYDAANKKTKYTDAVGKVTTYVYDADGNVLTENRPDGTAVNYAYDTRDLNTSIDYPGTAADIAYTYDALGRKITEQKGTDPVSTYAYNAIGQLTSRGPPNNTVTYTYDATGNIFTLTYPSGRVVTYGYNDDSELNSLATAGISNIGFAYNNRGLNTTTTLPNGVTETKTYDDKSRLASVDLSKNSASIYSKSQTYTAAGNISQKGMSSDGSAPAASVLHDFTYDPLSRLTGKNKDSDKSAINAYAYDAVGNLVTNDGITQTYDDAGKILSSGTTAFSYDGLNNRLSAVDTGNSAKNVELAWSADNTLSKATTHKTSTPAQVDYSYDALGLLKNRTAGSDSKNFVWDVNSNIPRLLSDGDYEYIYGAGRIPLAQVKLSDGAITYLQTDLNGSVTALTDANGALAGSIDYSPYGKATGILASRFGYAGEWTDPSTGFVYLRARWIDTNTGTFLSEDPLAQITGQAFGYTAGNPLQQVDPLGLCNAFAGDLFNLGSDCYSFADSQAFKSISDGAAGFGDSVTMGGTNLIREAIGVNNVVSTCSTSYSVGEWAGTAASFLIPGGGEVKAGEMAFAKAGKNIWSRFSQVRKEEGGYIIKPQGKNLVDSSKEGVIYWREDKNGILPPYVGQAKSQERYLKRQDEHQEAHPNSWFEFTEIGNAHPNTQNPKTRELSRMEEYFIRQNGGPKSTGGTLSNNRHEMSDIRYEKYGGGY